MGQGHGLRAPGRARRGVSPLVGTVLLVSIMLVLVALLYQSVVVPLSPPPPYVALETTYNSTPFVVYGPDNDPGSNQCPAFDGHVCLTTNGIVSVVSQVQAPSPALVDLTFYFVCNGTAIMSAPLLSLEDPAAATVDGGGPGSGSGEGCPGTASAGAGPGPGPGPGPGSPGSGCINPPAPADSMINLVYFVPANPGADALLAGSTFDIYGSTCHYAIDSTLGDDAYGPPPFCLVTPGACSLLLLDSAGSGVSRLATIPFVA